MLANRFLINLRSLNNPSRSHSDSSFHASRFSIPNFQIPDRILGNIGESLEDGHSEFDEPISEELEAAVLEMDTRTSTRSLVEFASPGSEVAQAGPVISESHETTTIV